MCVCVWVGVGAGMGGGGARRRAAGGAKREGVAQAEAMSLEPLRPLVLCKAAAQAQMGRQGCIAAHGRAELRLTKVADGLDSLPAMLTPLNQVKVAPCMSSKATDRGTR